MQEKLGQLTQVRGGRSKQLNSLVDDAQLELVREGRVGSYLHVAGASFLTKLQRVAVEQTRLGIPLLFGLDVVHGYRTIFPVPLAAACSWDPEAVEQAARIAAREATAAGLHWTFAPMVDIARDVRWGRIVEGAGEDPYLGSVMAAAQVRGYQGDQLAAPDTMLACPKHFVAYGAAVGGRDYDSADLSDRTLAEVYLPPFRAALDAGAGSVMSAFNDVSGIPMTAHRSLLTELLRDQWGFVGVVLSDWNAIAELVNHGVAADRAEAGVLALTAGVDMDMVSGIYQQELAPKVASGQAGEELVDQAVRRVLLVKSRLGLLQDPLRYGSRERERAQHLSAQHVAAARSLARKSFVLLKNEGPTLPLAKNLGKLAVIGPLADNRDAPLGSWKALGSADDVVTVLAGIRAAVSADTRVDHAPGCEVAGADTDGLAEAVRVAQAADAVVLVVGESADLSGEARSRSELGLPGVQQQLAERVVATGRPVAVVLMGGRPLAIPWVAANAPALIAAWLPGIQAGPAVADVLFGDFSPGGKLVATFPRRVGQLPCYYNHLNTGRPASEDRTKDTARYIDLPTTPLYAFGHGLSYTRFSYHGLQIRSAEVSAGDVAEIMFQLANLGDRPGDEVVQLYIRDPVARVARPVLELKGFSRVSLAARETVTVTFKVPVDLLGHYDQHHNYGVEPGRIEVLVGRASDDIRLQGALEVVDAGPEASPPGTLFSEAVVERQPSAAPRR